MISDRITLTVNRIVGNRVALAFDAPQHVNIRRSELPVFDEGIDDEFDGSRELPVSSDDTGPECE